MHLITLFGGLAHNFNFCAHFSRSRWLDNRGGDGTACAVVNQLWAWLFANNKKYFQCINSQFYSWLMTAQAV